MIGSSETTGTRRLDRFFSISARGSSVATEVRAGFTTFLTMAYILFVNPDILSKAGLPAGDVAVATALASAVATLLMGLLARYPFALAPGMGLNAFFAFGVVLGLEVPWRVALAAVFVEGILFMLLAWGGVRTLLLNAIPLSIKRATTVGIGVFLALIGLRNAGVVVDHPETLVTLGNLQDERVLLSLAGLVLVAALMIRGMRGAIIVGILTVAAVSWCRGHSAPPEHWVAWPSWPQETLLALDFSEVATGTFVTVVLAFLFVDLFDTAGTLIGVGTRAGFVDEKGRLPGSDRAFFADACGTAVGALLGTSTVTSYVESASGVAEGGRTGLTAVVVAFLFLSAIVFAPVFVAVPAFATAPALIVVGALMMSSARDIEWGRLEDALPSFLCIVVMPFTYNIANGISAAIVAHVGIRVLAGRWRDIHPMMAVVALLLAAYHLLLRSGG